MAKLFSDLEITAFRRLLEGERERLRRRLTRDQAEMEGYLGRVAERDPCAYLSPAAATEQMDQEDRLRLAQQARAELAEVEHALERIAVPDSFGICEKCGERISVARLEMLPQTRLCQGCASGAEAQA
jgi:DnaK suppressor protein